MMATSLKDDTVWIGFMDIVPVIGTVKEAVELVLAVYEENKAVIKEKEEAIENIVNKLTLPDKPAAATDEFLTDKPAAAGDEFSGLRNVREVRMEMIIEYMGKGSKVGTKPPTSAEQKEREEKVEAIKKDMLEKIHILKPKFRPALKKELRSKRGEHVFNNDILKFHSKVLKKFIKSHHSILQEYNQHQQAMNELGRHTLPLKTVKDIQTNMVVHFGEDEFYMNANGVVYGVYCTALRDAMFNVLRHINPDDVTEAERQRVNFVIDNMNKHEIYVDEIAKVTWIASTATRQARFERVRREVANMYKTDRGFDWCIRAIRQKTFLRIGPGADLLRH